MGDINFSLKNISSFIRIQAHYMLFFSSGEIIILIIYILTKAFVRTQSYVKEATHKCDITYPSSTLDVIHLERLSCSTDAVQFCVLLKLSLKKLMNIKRQPFYIFFS